MSKDSDSDARQRLAIEAVKKWAQEVIDGQSIQVVGRDFGRVIHTVAECAEFALQAMKELGEMRDAFRPMRDHLRMKVAHGVELSDGERATLRSLELAVRDWS